MNPAMRESPIFTVYVIELDASVLSLGRFAEVNPKYVFRSSRPPLYVGMTAHTPEERFKQRRNGYKASRYTRNKALRLRMDLAGGLVCPTRAEAEQMEELHATRLRALGYAVWQN